MSGAGFEAEASTCATLRAIFAEVLAAGDGARLTAAAAEGLALAGPPHVLALGKAAGPMLAGLRARLPLAEVLVITPRTEAAQVEASADTLVHLADHPTPSPASLTAAVAARDFVASRPAGTPLVVLLSGGGSALACLPAGGLTLADKVAATRALAAAGATIHELNTVRKHLSALKGGQLALLARGPVRVLALSDVVGDDPATIASGPFSADPTTYSEALAILDYLAPDAAPAAHAHLARGLAGGLEETPKPGRPEFRHVDYRVLAGPAFVRTAATGAAEARGLGLEVRFADTEATVETLAGGYAAGARPGTLVIGNGEPRVVLGATPGRGGRATHLALLVARAIAGQPALGFLAAGTDGRDGAAGAAGAVVDGTTWPMAEARGLAPAAALARHDSATVLGALGALVEAPCRTNLLDVHLLLAPPG